MLNNTMMIESNAGLNFKMMVVMIMKFGIRKPSLKKSIAARTSIKRMVRHNLGLKAKRGYGWFTNPKKAAYNRIYNRTSISLFSLIKKLFK